MPGELILKEFSETPTISCPGLGWEYDVTTGEHLGEASVSLATLEVVVDDGTVYVEMWAWLEPQTPPTGGCLVSGSGR